MSDSDCGKYDILVALTKRVPRDVFQPVAMNDFKKKIYIVHLHCVFRKRSQIICYICHIYIYMCVCVLYMSYMFVTSQETFVISCIK